MIIRELYTTRNDGVKLFINYSDIGMKIQQEQTGAVYDSAIDVEMASYTYTEINEQVDEHVDAEYHAPTPTKSEYAEAGRIMMGVET